MLRRLIMYIGWQCNKKKVLCGASLGGPKCVLASEAKRKEVLYVIRDTP